MRIDRDREQELATTVQAARGRLLNLLTKHERKTTRRHGSAEPETFEDHAREIADNTSEFASPRSRLISDALNFYQNAINAFWRHAQECGVAGYLTATWRQKHKGYSWIAREDLECEALFKLRHFIGLFKPSNGNLADYAMRGMHQHLTEFAAKQGPVELARDARRGAGVGPDSHRISLDVIEAAKERDNLGDTFAGNDGVYRQGHDISVDSWDVIDAYFDDDITDDDL